MKIFKQRNVYYLNLKKRILAGYTEVHIQRKLKENKILFRSNCLNIQSINIICSENIPLQPNYTIKGQPSTKSFADGFEVILPDNYKFSTCILRIVFERETEKSMNNNYNPGIIFYDPINLQDEHREMIIEDSAYGCPYIDQVTNVEMIYVLPNSRNIELTSSGKFISFSETSNSLIYIYEAKNINPNQLCFALGTYQSKSILDEENVYLPSSLNLTIDEFISDTQNILKYYNMYSELTPPSIVFSLCPVKILTGKNLIIMNISYLGRPKDIELNFRLKEIICELLAEQMFMFFNHTLVDTWIFQGFTGYLTDMGLRFLLGHNEFLYRYKRDRDYCVDNDIIEPPLFYSERVKEEYKSKFFKLKSKLVFHTIHNQLSGAFVKKLITTVIKLKKIEIENIASIDINKNVNNLNKYNDDKYTNFSKVELNINNETSTDKHISNDNCDSYKFYFTPSFIRIVKDSSGKDMKAFFDFYVFNPGLLIIDLIVKINLKKGLVVIEPKETITTKIKTNNTTHYSFIKLKSIETDGVFNQKISSTSSSSYLIHKKSDNGTVLFVRADCKREIFGKIRINQPEALYIEQLLDKSVIGQFEAVEFFKNNTSEKAIEALERVAENPHTFHRVKNEIYKVLKNIYFQHYGNDNNKESNYNGLMRLIQFFIKLKCVPNSTIVKNTELGILNFLIQKSLVKNITDFENEQNVKSNEKNINVIIAFLNNIINYNDTTKEHFNDPFYLSNILNKLCIYKIHLSSTLDDQNLFSEIERFRFLDMVFPSPHNVISKTCLICLLRLAYAKKINLSKKFLLDISKYPNFISLRQIAIEGLFLFYIKEITFKQFIESTIIIEIVLKIIITMMEHGFKSIKIFVKDNYEDIFSLYKKFIGHRLEVLFELILGKTTINKNDYVHQKIYEINYALENKNEINLVVEQCLGNKKVIISDLNVIRKLVFKKLFKITLHKMNKIEKKTEKEVPIVDNKQLVVLKCLKYRPISIFKSYIIRLRMTDITIRYRNCDIPYLIFQGIRGTKSFTAIEKYLRGLKNNEKYDSDVLSIKRIEEEFSRERMITNYLRVQKGQKPNQYTLHNFIETLFTKCIRFLFLYIPINSKLYLGVKNIIMVIDKILYQYSLIQHTIILMTEDLRLRCIDFVEHLIKNSEYKWFVNDIIKEQPSNHTDLIQHPISLNCIWDKLIGNSIKTKDEFLPDIIFKYKSFNVFYLDLKSIATNTMMCFSKETTVYTRAKNLLYEIELFKSKLLLTKSNTIEVLKNIFKEYDTKNFDLEIDWNVVRTWEDLDNELYEIKKKYSRYSQNGKIVNEKINKVKQIIEMYFYINGNKITNIEDI